MSDTSTKTSRTVRVTTRLTNEQRGEIALAHLKFKLRQNGVNIGNDLVRELGQVARESGIDIELIRTFALEMGLEHMLNVLGPKDAKGDPRTEISVE